MPHSLTQRQRDVLRLAAQGKTNKRIALTLGISTKTVEKHLNAVYRKFGVQTRTEAVLIVERAGLLNEKRE